MTNKKKQIFQAVINLYQTSGALSNLTISEIANYADIGKGTVYEYFKSKDELIGETIIYMMEENSKKVFGNYNEDHPFKEVMLQHIKTVNEILQENYSFHFMLMTDEFKNIINDEMKQKIMGIIFEQRKQYYQFLIKVMNKGIRELNLNPIEDQFTIVTIGNIIFTSILYNIHENLKQIESNELIEKIYRLIIKIIS